MAKIIEAKAVISGEERLSPLLDKLSRKLDQVRRNAKTAEAVDKMSAALARANQQMSAMEKFNASKIGFVNARQQFREAEVAVQRAARAMAQANGPSKELAANYQRAQKAVTAAAAAFDRQKQAVLSAKHTLEGLGGSARDIAGQQLRLAAAVDKASAAIDRQHRRAARRQNIAAGVASVLGAAAIGYRARSFAGKAIVSAAEFDYAARKQRELTEGDISKADQASVLIPQAKRIGQETRFTNLDVIQAQTASMQGLPTNIVGRTRAEVGAGIMEHVKNYAIVMETDLKTAAETVRTYLQTTGKDISTKEKALRESQLAVNRIVRMAKLGGMTGEDVPQYLKYGAGANSVVGVDEDAFLAIGALAKRAGLPGEEAGVFMRQVAAKLAAPSKKGLTAMRAAGIDYNRFVRMPGKLDTGRLESQFQQELGIRFTPAVRKKLDSVLSNYVIVSDRNKFTAAVSDATAPLFPRSRGGKIAAADKAKVAKAAGEFHKTSAAGVDAQGLLDTLMRSNLTLAQINSILDYRQGGRYAVTARQREEYIAAREKLRETDNDQTFAKKKADEIMGGLGGALENLKGSFENLQQAIGEANEGLLKLSFDTIGKGFDWVSNLSVEARQAATALGAIATLGTGAFIMKQLFSGFGLTSSAAALDGAAVALTAAAGKLGAAGVPAAAGGAAAAAGGGAAAAASIVKGGALAAGIAALEVINRDSKAGNPLRTKMRSFFGIDDPGEPAPWMPGGSWNRDQAPPDLKGEVKGEAKVTLDLSGLGISRSWDVRVPLKGTIGTNGPGSLGTSSPDAAAPAGGP